MILYDMPLALAMPPCSAQCSLSRRGNTPLFSTLLYLCTGAFAFPLTIGVGWGWQMKQVMSRNFTYKK